MERPLVGVVAVATIVLRLSAMHVDPDQVHDPWPVAAIR
jgi:hypothetical protein